MAPGPSVKYGAALIVNTSGQRDNPVSVSSGAEWTARRLCHSEWGKRRTLTTIGAVSYDRRGRYYMALMRIPEFCKDKRSAPVYSGG
jgi:hypothetical protein